jgi:hypothetical protein
MTRVLYERIKGRQWQPRTSGPRFLTYKPTSPRTSKATGAHEWAAKCIGYREAGKLVQAKAAEQKARHWLRKVMALEARVAHGKPVGPVGFLVQKGRGVTQ